MKTETEIKLEREIEEPEDFDMGDEFQMQIYDYGYSKGRRKTKKAVEKMIKNLWKGQRSHKKHYLIDIQGHKVCLKCYNEKFRDDLLRRLKDL
ncbi:MAG: hypothetical protein PHD43_23320 [Methylococcales bacterium]|nr:hypothetical protein [Candidatus Paceibacterota bacterium]MDD5323479.1 hypothetical protein [Methylococcales bacterium]